MDFGARFNFRSQIQKTYYPSVMVTTTVAAEQSARKNDLTFVDLLLPHAVVNTSNITFQSQGEGSKGTYKLPEFRVNFCNVSDIGQPPEQFVDVQCARVVDQGSKEAEGSIASITSRADVPAYLTGRDGLPRDATPWFTRWRKEFMRGLRCSNFEYFDHPVACIIVASSEEEDAIIKFRSLFDMAKLPPLFREGAIDPSIFLHYVLLHDEQTADKRKTEEILRKMRETFGPSATTMIQVNSLPADQPNLEQPDIWAQHREFGESARGPRGRFLSVQDIASVQKFVADFVGIHLIPHLDRKIKNLNNIVTSSKKGFKNQWKSWWKGTKGTEPREGYVESAEGGCPQYLYNSIEAQVRQLADIAFMLQDYELALSNYRLVQADYKKDKAWYQFAAANEMTALSLYMLDGSKREAESCLDMAYSNYQRCGMSRHTIRVTLLQMDMHKSRSKMKEASESLLRCASSETDDLRAALLLEQAALCFLQMSPNAHFRKFALHLVLAGHRFYKCQQRSHALQCYMSALHTYRGRCWTYVDDHIHSTLAKHSVALGRLDDAIAFSLRLLGNTSNKTVEKQTAYLHDFINIIKKHFSDKTRWVTDQPTPTIDNASVRVITNDRTHPSVADDLGGEEVWEELEEILVEEARYREKRKHERGNQLQNFRRTFDDTIDRNEHKAVVGEQVIVQFTMKNNLQVGIEIAEIGVICECSGMTFGTGEEIHEEDVPVIIEQQIIHLAPQQHSTVRLGLTPTRPGSLKIVGVAWKLDNVVLSRHDFVIRGKRLNSTLDERVSAMYEADSRLLLTVVEPMPLLAVTMHHFPSTMIAGEVARAELEIKNIGNKMARSLKFNCNRPSAIAVCEPSACPSWPSSVKECDQQMQVECKELYHRDVDGVYSVVLPIEELQPQASTRVSLWVRAETTGVHNFKIVLYYQSPPEEKSGEESNSSRKKEVKMKYRLVRHAERLMVHPSIQSTIHIRPSRKAIDEFILALTLESLRQEGMFELCQLSCLSKFWSLSPLSATAGVDTLAGKFMLQPRNRVTVFFKLRPAASDSSQTENDKMTHLSHVSFENSQKCVNLFDSPHMQLFAQKDVLCCLPFRKINATANPDEPLACGSPHHGGTPPADFLLVFGFPEKPYSCHIHFDSKTANAVVVRESRSRRGSQANIAAPTSTTPTNASTSTTTNNNNNQQQQQTPSGHRPSIDGSHHLPRRKSVVGREMALSPLKFKIDCPSVIKADFTNGNLCEVQGFLHIWNSDATASVTFVFEATNENIVDALPSVPTPANTMHDYIWSGHLTKKVDLLSPRSTISVPFSVIVPRPGIYNLNRFYLNVSTPGMTSVDAALSDMQHLITVEG